jgi:hypothetical protein
VATLTRPEEFQYLAVRSAMCQALSRNVLSSYEKAVLQRRLMLFVPQAAVRMVAFLERNGGFHQEGVFRIAPAKHLLDGALAQMELCTSRARILGDDAAATEFPVRE